MTEQLTKIMWYGWIRSLQWVVMVISVAFYEQNEGKRILNRGIWWRTTNRLWTWTIAICNKIWTWIERNAGLPRNRLTVALTINKPRHRSRMTFAAMSMLAMQTNATKKATEQTVRFDTDSDVIGVDNRCTSCILYIKDDFVGELKACNRAVKGFEGTRTMNVQTGTLRWRWRTTKESYIRLTSLGPTTSRTDEFAC
jgi:hypothetical protein